MVQQSRFVVGVDEAGRGALAGPVAVGVFAVVVENKDEFFDKLSMADVPVRDSKKLTPRQRTALKSHIDALTQDGLCRYSVALVGSGIIDTQGITKAVYLGIRKALARVGVEPALSCIMLDGLLKAPRRFKSQRTIVGGDDIEPVISLASVMAKVTRDRYMEKISKRYPAYAFAKHKGYGTKEHCAKLSKVGPCSIHRLGYIGKIKTRS